jgi:large subunit ribosomal protein L24
MAAHLSPELRASHGVRSFPVRTGDTVRVVRGDHKGVEGKITSVKLPKYRIFVEGLTREKVDGTTINVPIHPSKVMVTRLNLDDKWRKEILDLKKKGHKELEKAEKAAKAEKPAPKLELKPEEEPVKVKEEAKEVVEEKPAAKAKVAKKKPAAARKRPARKKKAEKAVPEAKEAKSEVKRETKEKTKPSAKPKRTSRKTAKKTEEGEE